MSLARIQLPLNLARSSRYAWAALFLSAAVLPSVAQNQTWIRTLDSGEQDEVYGAAPDGAGGVYATGRTLGSLGGPNVGGYDAWIARYDGDGNPLWIRQLGSTEWDHGQGAAPGAAGDVYLCGRTDGSLGGQFAGLGDAWFARYDDAGNLAWVRQLGTSALDFATGLAADGAGGVYATGSTGGDLAAANSGEFDAWLARYDSAGNPAWIVQFGTTQDDLPRTAAPDGAGGVFLSGLTSGDLGGTHAGDGDAFVARYDGGGNQLWIRQLGTTRADMVLAAAPDGSGGVYLGGSTEGNVGGPNAGGSDPWAARFDGEGNLLWVHQFGTSARFEETYAAASASAGGVYLGGDARAADASPLGAWMAHFDADGNDFWIRAPVLTASENAHAAAPDGAGGVFFAGRFARHRGDVWLGRYEDLCGPASASMRNAGPNPESLQVSVPALGSAFTATVDLSTTGHDLAVLSAFDGAVDITRPGGQHVLAGNVHGHGTLYRATQPGPLATFQFAIPLDANLCGFEVHMQAVHFGGVVPFALSNAQDLIVGE